MLFQVCLVCSVMVLCISISITQSSEVVQEPPEGYYAFVESPNAEPPRVRRPPYQHSNKECSGLCQNQSCVLGPQSVKFGSQYQFHLFHCSLHNGSSHTGTHVSLSLHYQSVYFTHKDQTLIPLILVWVLYTVMFWSNLVLICISQLQTL
jgi:hypothetical protein